jgi:hypothetical protein
MNDFIQIVSSLREQMQATLSRSDALKPLAWLMGMLLTALLVSAYLQAHTAIQILLGTLLGLSGALYLFAYTFCLVKIPDALRSERYSLHKMAIEHGLLGDSSSGAMFGAEELSKRAPEDVVSKQKIIEHDR